jgi:hypothetical protein
LGVEVSTVRTSHPTTPTEDVITTKGLQERTQQLNGTTVKNENKGD